MSGTYAQPAGSAAPAGGPAANVVNLADPAAEGRRIFRLQREAFMRAGAPDHAARRAALTRLERLILDNSEALVDAISADFGHRSREETQLAEFVPCLNAIRFARRHVRRWMRPERRHVAIIFQPASAWVQYQPLGVVGIIVPWNYPLFLALGPLVDALAAGNRAMIKPSELTPRFAELFHDLIGRSFTEEEVAVVNGGPDVAAAFTRLPFDHLLFTGSTAVGRKVMAAAAENLTPVTLELGGKSPTVVCADYPSAKAAKTIAFGKFFNAGQTCIAPDYVLAPRGQVAELAEEIMAAARRAYPQVAANPDYTSIISDRHYARLSGAVEEARKAGATVLQHEEPEAAKGRKLGPTVVIDPPRDGLLMREEIFGPVLPVLPYDSLEDAVQTINAGDRPLALYVMTNDAANRDRVLNETISGGVTLNGTLLHCAQDDLPFGGVGPSGIGAYHGREGFKRFSHARAVYKVGFVNPFEMIGAPYGKLTRLMSKYLMGG
ncbi:MAG TPA: coniferyl aldehyde dehydrogenase [Acidisphaera sp.]|nr:coniferyl aldehyde dehydrogenase [Acidisphaera sp.]